MLVRTQNLAKTYGTLPVLRGVSLEVAAGERLVILGKSGSGKSTLLHLLGGLDVPTAGEILVENRNLATLSRNERAHYRLVTAGIIFQAFHLVADRTALENVELPLVFAGLSRRERRQQALAALESVGLTERRDHRPNQLSGGERQRVAVARAMINRPKILLADEPTGNLDSTTGQEVIAAILERLTANGTALVLVTHDEELAARIAHRIVRMRDGIIEAV